MPGIPYITVQNCILAPTLKFSRNYCELCWRSVPVTMAPEPQENAGVDHQTTAQLAPSNEGSENEKELALKERLDLYLEKVQDCDAELQKLGLESIRQEIQAAASSITSFPKSLEFLTPHYQSLKGYYEKITDGELKMSLANIISVLALSTSKDDERESLKFRLLGSVGEMGSWGQEYVRNLAGEIGVEFQERQLEKAPVYDLMDLVSQIVQFYLKHNAESEAVDLLMEVESLELLIGYMDRSNYKQTCSYLTSFASYVLAPKDMLMLDIAYRIYMNFENYPQAIRVALRMDNIQYVKDTFKHCQNFSEKQQLCYILARQGVTLELDDSSLAIDEHRELLQEIISNSKLSESYLRPASELHAMKPKTTDDIYLAHLVGGQGSAGNSVDSARQNLAATFANAFVNAGFGQDKLMTFQSARSSSESWIFRNKDHGKASAAASLGLILLWNVDGGLPQVDKYFYSNDSNIRAGALLAVGIVNCNVRSECDPAYALLYDFVNNKDSTICIGAIMGLGLAYAGSWKEEVLELLTPVMTNSKVGLDVAGFAAISLGLVYVGSCHEKIANSILHILMERSETELEEPMARFLCHGLGLLYLGKQEAVDLTMDKAKILNPKVSQYLQVILDSCAYAGSGNVLKRGSKPVGNPAEPGHKGPTLTKRDLHGRMG